MPPAHPEWLILIGAGSFIGVLAAWALWEADIRWRHFFQAWRYVVAAALSLRRNRWGHCVAIAAAGLWGRYDPFCHDVFPKRPATRLPWIRTGQLAGPDLLITVPAWPANFLAILGGLSPYSRLSEKGIGGMGRFRIAFALTTGFFAADMALFQPRYLALFPRMLHPHLP